MLRAVRSHWRLVAGAVLVALAVAGALTWVAPREYASSTQLFVSVAGGRNATDPYNNDLFSQQRAVSYVQVLTGPELAQRVVDELALPLTADEVAAKISAAPVPDTVVLDVSVRDESPQRAQAIAASVTRQFESEVRALETPDGAATPNVTVRPIKTAEVNPTPVSPDVVRNLALGVAIGLVLGLALALLRNRMDTSVRDDEDARAATGTRVLGKVLDDRRLAKNHVLSGSDGHSSAVEAFRAIRVNVQHTDHGARPQVIVVTGALPGDGASTVAVNLSVSLARAGHRVLLLDGNLRRPRVARYLGLEEDGPGLTDVLEGVAELREALQPWKDGVLTVLGAGPLPEDPDAVLSSPRLSALLSVMRDTHEFVVIDAPPLLPVVDAAVLSSVADGCLLVARTGKTTHDQLSEAVATVERAGGTVLGTVLNRASRPGTVTGGRGRRSYSADHDRGRSHTVAGRGGSATRSTAATTPPVPAASPGKE